MGDSGRTMGDSGTDVGRLIGRVLAGLALSDVAYRLFVREALRRALGIEAKHA